MPWFRADPTEGTDIITSYKQSIAVDWFQVNTLVAVYSRRSEMEWHIISEIINQTRASTIRYEAIVNALFPLSWLLSSVV